MHVRVLVRVLAGVGVLNHSASGLRFLDDPRTIALFQVVGNLHSRAFLRTIFRTEDDFGMCLIAVDGHAANVHVHGAHVERAHSVKMLQNTGANGVIIGPLFAAGTEQKRSREQQG